MWLSVMFVLVYYTPNVQLFFYQEFLQLFLSFSQHCDSFLSLLFQLFDGGLLWKCILTKVSYAILTLLFVVKVTLLQMQTQWLRGTLHPANFHSHYFSDTYFGLYYPWPRCFKFLTIPSAFVIFLLQFIAALILFHLVKSFQNLTLRKNIFSSTFCSHHHLPQCS